MRPGAVLGALLAAHSAAAYSCAQSCIDSEVSKVCGSTARVDNCTQAQNGDVRLACSRPCFTYTLDVNGCSRQATCSWFHRLLQTLVNLLSDSMDSFDNASEGLQYAIAIVSLIVGALLCLAGSHFFVGSLSWSGFALGSMLGYAIGITAGLSQTSQSDSIWLAVASGGGGLLLSVLFTGFQEQALFVIGGVFLACGPVALCALGNFAWSETVQLAVAASLAVVLFVAGGLLALRQPLPVMILWTSLLGALLVGFGTVYVATQKNLVTAWSDTKAHSTWILAAALPGSFLLGVVVQCCYNMTTESERQQAHRYSRLSTPGTPMLRRKPWPRRNQPIEIVSDSEAP
eukprot:TRINITY_DN61946_c0_g1_i1.p1 TRINITY_DN61946_c0_g1~~TRINITY_DN61946_c0_g1_i1.p1  ORF type:complete len:377 (+),score=135.90 TRINITY_DN61946_c0_g1_i1:98-1132(+)